MSLLRQNATYIRHNCRRGCRHSGFLHLVVVEQKTKDSTTIEVAKSRRAKRFDCTSGQITRPNSYDRDEMYDVGIKIQLVERSDIARH